VFQGLRFQRREQSKHIDQTTEQFHSPHTIFLDDPFNLHILSLLPEIL
jgi:hypothetical protein